MATRNYSTIYAASTGTKVKIGVPQNYSQLYNNNHISDQIRFSTVTRKQPLYDISHYCPL